MQHVVQEDKGFDKGEGGDTVGNGTSKTRFSASLRCGPSMGIGTGVHMAMPR
jgi:hypothetical protein